MRKIIITALIVLLMSSTGFTEIGVIFESEPGRRPLWIQKHLSSSYDVSGATQDFNQDGTPDISGIFGGSGNDQLRVWDGKTKEILWEFDYTNIILMPEVGLLGFLRFNQPGTEICPVLINQTSDDVLQFWIINPVDNEVLFHMENVVLVGVRDLNNDNVDEIVAWDLGTHVIKVISDMLGGLAKGAYKSPVSDSFNKNAISSAYSLEIKFESESGRQLVISAGQFAAPGAFDVNNDEVTELVIFVENNTDDSSAVAVLDGENFVLKWGFRIPEESEEDILRGCHGFFDVDGNGFKEAIFGHGTVVTLDQTVHSLPENFEIHAIFDLNKDGFPEIIGNNTADTTVQVWGKQSVTSITSHDLEMAGFQLYQNYPNPFNPTTTIPFSVMNRNHVSLKVYDLHGREVVNLLDEMRSSGSYQARFTADNISSGIYFYHLQIGNMQEVKKMIFTK